MSARRVLAALVPLALSCLDFTSPGATFSDRPDVRPYVTPAVAIALDGEGHFTLDDVVDDTPHPVLGRERASELAIAMVQEFLVKLRVVALPGAEVLRQSVEEAYGGPIEWSAVTLGSRGAYASLFPFAPIPDDAPIYARNYWGPHYLVPMYIGNEQVLVVTVAAHATEIVLHPDGQLEFPGNSGNEFAGHGLPRGGTVTIPVEPERAVAEVATAFRRRIDAVPRLLQPGHRTRFSASKWELVLDSPTEVLRVATGDTLTVNRIYVGVYGSVFEGFSDTPELRFFAAPPEQPAAELASYQEGSIDGPTVEVSLTRVADRPIDFVEVRALP